MEANDSKGTRNVKSYNVMPDFSKTISVFNGEDLSKAKPWLNEIETTARLHDWPSAFMLETAKNHLTSAARHWYEARKADIGTWVTFRDEFKKTFIHERNLTTLWKQMTVRVQGPREVLSVYFHEKIKMCVQLGLDFDEQKEQVVIGLESRELASMIA
ncbi:hypothetical protein QE152_g17919 [Popillia japonica]|uniref:Retrotransposon gag domain-containing protein n=1 Tax=Popillia japonica TaxID=7064 RepID=A0AAW1L564_POPJA